MTDSLSVQVCIMGAGPVGGTLACRLARAGVRVALIDQAELAPMEHPAFDGRAYAIAAGSRTVLEEAGLWTTLDVPPNPIRDILITDGKIGRGSSRRHLHFDHREANSISIPFGWMVEARSLRKAMHARFSETPNLYVYAPARAVAERLSGSAVVHLSEGTTIRCSLLVGAEGRNSPLRESAGIDVTRFSYHQTAMVCAVAHDLPHHDLALEHFLPAGPFAMLPMGPSVDAEPNGAENISAVVWTESSENAALLMTLDKVRFARELERRLGRQLGRIRMVGLRWSYPLSAMIAHRYADARLALVGDAAHGIHPIAGQGLNLGLRDVIALGKLIVDASISGSDLGNSTLLNEYQRERQSDNMLMFAMTDGLDRLFSTDRQAIRAPRDLAIDSVNRIDVMKRMFMRQAMGLAAAVG